MVTGHGQLKITAKKKKERKGHGSCLKTRSPSMQMVNGPRNNNTNAGHNNGLKEKSIDIAGEQTMHSAFHG